MDTNGKQLIDSGGNQDKPNAEVSKEPDSDKDNSAAGLSTPDKTLELSLGASLSLPIN